MGWPGRIFLGLAVLIAAAYPFENWRGAKALQRELDIMQEKGIAVDWHDLLRGPVPDDQNFGAIPLLKGLGADPPPESLDARTLEFTEWNGLHVSIRSSITEDWSRMRERLTKTSHFRPSPEERSDTRAIYQTLDRLEPVFDELARAATLPEAVLTPSPLERLGNAPHGKITWGNTPQPLRGLTNLLEVRAALAVELNDGTEALRMMRILPRLDEASAILKPASAIPPVRLVVKGLQRNLWNPSQLNEIARILTIATPSERAVAYYHRLMVQDYAQSLVPPGEEDARSLTKTWWEIHLPPRGWMDQERATLLRTARERLILPIRAHGLEALSDGKAGIRDEDVPGLPTPMFGSWIFRFREEIREEILTNERLRRLTILALEAERIRLEQGRFPEDVSKILPVLPPDQHKDLEGRPLTLQAVRDLLSQKTKARP